MASIEKLVRERILILDGAMGTMIQQYNLTEEDFRGEYFAHVSGQLKGNNAVSYTHLYLGWHSKNLRLVNCHITGEQPLCYAHDLILENCTFGPDCDRAFEYSTLQADIRGTITNIKNPMSGRIVADEFGSITIDENIKAPADCEIRLRDERTCFTD